MMFHPKTVLSFALVVKCPGGAARIRRFSMVARLRSLVSLGTVAVALGAAACGGDGGTQPGSLRFGQIGEVRLHLSTPLLAAQGEEGELQQSLTWNSSGPWQLTEAISYKRNGEFQQGGQVTRPQSINAGYYASWITLINDPGALNLFIAELDRTLEPDCGLGRTRIQLRIKDAVLDEERRWVRCVEGSLSQFGPGGAGPDTWASRVAQSAMILRDFAFPAAFLSAYHASFPFATLLKGDATPVPLTAPWVIDNQQNWNEFWSAHTGSSAGLPPVDFSREMVLIATVGQRFESGESVEVRRVLPVDNGTLVEVVWRVPGNFCSPVNRDYRPFHAVVTPKLPRPVVFAQVQREDVPCGGS